ncbi:SOUL family heme-binding protein [Pseudoalteromonas sp. SSDWG2]|uniref:SOUL family heme-binding protein n=1 Tax=Pseudoalteromonas sp. SSDWG2 TaxID=3139391 RepID=UPI003BAA167B
MKGIFLFLFVLFLSGCSVFGVNGVESAPYTVLDTDEQANIEVRSYQSMVLVSASMDNNAFRRLFRYISGENKGQKEIAMTAPVFMNDDRQGMKIAMTAPVFMTQNTQGAFMSFVMPSEFTLETTPEPLDPNLVVSQVIDYTAAAIQFSGTMSQRNVLKHTELLKSWLIENDYVALGYPVKAGYNGPWTIPKMRRNEILFAVSKNQ